MDTAVAIVFALLGILATVIAVLFFGVCGLVAMIVVWVVILALVETGTASRGPTTQPQAFRYACPGCGGDVYSDQVACPACGQVFAAAPPPAEAPLQKFCPTCGARYPGEYRLCPKDGSDLKALQ